MDSKAQEFRKRAGEENRGRAGTRLRYSRELRLAGVAYLRRRMRDGVGTEQVSSELGVSNTSLSRSADEPSGTLRRVEVVPKEEGLAELSLVTPRGYRLEGLSVDVALRLVERLG